MNKFIIRNKTKIANFLLLLTIILYLIVAFYVPTYRTTMGFAYIALILILTKK